MPNSLLVWSSPGNSAEFSREPKVVGVTFRGLRDTLSVVRACGSLVKGVWNLVSEGCVCVAASDCWIGESVLIDVFVCI